MISVMYSLVTILVAYAVDWAFYGRITNIISISRLSKGEIDPDQPYNVTRAWRVTCAALSGVIFFGSTFFRSVVQNVLYAGIAITVVVMLVFTYIECTSQPR